MLPQELRQTIAVSVAALALAAYGCTSDTQEQLRTGLAVVQEEAAEAQGAEMAERAAEAAKTALEAAEQQAAEAEADVRMAREEVGRLQHRIQLESVSMDDEERVYTDPPLRPSPSPNELLLEALYAALDSLAVAEAALAAAMHLLYEAQHEWELAQVELAVIRAELEVFREAQRAREREEQARRDAQILAGLPGGLARSPAPAVNAGSDLDTLAQLLPAGGVVFAPLSAALRRDYFGTDHGVRTPTLGAAYVKSLAGDGEGGFHVTYVIDGEETSVHFEADQYHAEYGEHGLFAHTTRDYLYDLWSYTDSFAEDSTDTAATDRTDGSTEFDYFDINGWVFGVGNGYDLRGFSTYGARTESNAFPLGSASYEGRRANLSKRLVGG